MRNVARYLPLLLILPLSDGVSAAGFKAHHVDPEKLNVMLVAADLTLQGCVDAGGSVEDSSLDCHYDFTESQAYGVGVTGEITFVYPPRDLPNTFPRTDLTCNVTCGATGPLVPERVVCLANPAWQYIQGCPATSELQEEIRRFYPGEGLIGTAAAQQCRDKIGDLDDFCDENMTATDGPAVPAFGNNGVDSKCCDLASPSPTSTPEESPVPTETPIDYFPPFD